MHLTKQRSNSKESERYYRLFFLKFLHQIRTILKTVEECFMLVGGAELTTAVPYGIVIIQGQAAQEVIQFLKSIADFRWVGFVGLCVGLVQLIQDGFAIAITRVKWVCVYVGFQPLSNLIHVGTSSLSVI